VQHVLIIVALVLLQQTVILLDVIRVMHMIQAQKLVPQFVILTVILAQNQTNVIQLDVRLALHMFQQHKHVALVLTIVLPAQLSDNVPLVLHFLL